MDLSRGRPTGSRPKYQSREDSKIRHAIAESMVNHDLPIGSMYAIYANIGGILMVNVTIYSITTDLNPNNINMVNCLPLGD